ncbi:hypothetical protein OH773_06790 [Buttiauxella sp. WJP83]|uniref:hypothetical protein n=1 Tax=Buttiauxella sp. WJP83 TaxID=2986951 RepID=UPI0022DD592D|nr:hypothetical protein [Buttiauxella sp. WJP83]WBM71942.1 hypothetical protein OH773_06790 [Buttiauxella sp. WJP83]
MKKMLMIVVASSVVLLAGCSTPEQRRAECEAQGISKDTCYLAEVQHKEAINTAAYNAQWANARDAAAGTGIWAKKKKK